MKQPRVMAWAVIRQDNRILLSECYDTETGEMYYRPFGGLVAYGERGEDTVTRELRDALGIGVTNVRFLGTLETLPGCGCHDLALVYEADVADQTLYMHSSIRRQDHAAEMGRAVWQFIEVLEQGDVGLLPGGLLDLIQEAGGAQLRTLFGSPGSQREGRLYGML